MSSNVDDLDDVVRRDWGDTIRYLGKVQYFDVLRLPRRNISNSAVIAIKSNEDTKPKLRINSKKYLLTRDRVNFGAHVTNKKQSIPASNIAIVQRTKETYIRQRR